MTMTKGRHMAIPRSKAFDTLLAAAVSGVLVGGAVTACGGAPAAPSTPSASPAPGAPAASVDAGAAPSSTADKASCKGQGGSGDKANCKGQGGCK
jgi:hypothetical protein